MTANELTAPGPKNEYSNSEKTSGHGGGNPGLWGEDDGLAKGDLVRSG
jgi:hypothetical protein